MPKLDPILEEFIDRAAEQYGEHVAERCATILATEIDSQKTPWLALGRARRELYKEQDDIAFPIEDMPCNT